MKHFAILAALALVGVTHVPPDLHHPVSAVEMQIGALQVTPGAFSSQHGAFVKTADQPGTYMEQLFAYAPSDLPPWTLVNRAG